MRKTNTWHVIMPFIYVLILSFAVLALDEEAGKLESTLCPNPTRTDMQGNWIWVPDSLGYEHRNSYAYFRKKFNAADKLTINIAADLRYQLFIDGKRINRGTARADIAYKTFDTHIVTVEPGEHVIAVLIHHIGQVCATAMKSRPGLFVEMITKSGSKIISDSSWKVKPADAFKQYLPCMMSHFGFYEVCDCRKIPQGWTQVSFNDSKWHNAEVIGKAGCPPWLRMIPRSIPLLETTPVLAKELVCHGTYKAGPLNEAEEDITIAVEMVARQRKKTETRANKLPIKLAEGKDNEFVVMDFGREVTGHIKLQFSEVKAGQKIDIGYDEMLNENSLPNPRRTYVHFADRFYLRRNQSEVEVFGGRGFRYLLIDVFAGKGGLTLTGVQIDERRYPVTKEGYFHCSNKALNNLYQTGINTIKLCMLDTYVGGPSRERVLWMDMYPEAHCSSWGFGITRLWRKCLYMFAQNTWKQGPLTGVIKAFVPCDYDPLLMSYTMYYVILVSDYLQHSGDKQTCEALFSTVMKQFELIEQQCTTKDGLIDHKLFSWETFLDWSAMDFGGISACDNAIYILMHRKTARMAEQLQKHDLAKKLRENADKLVVSFRNHFWSEEEGLFVDALYNGKSSSIRSQLANVMAIWAGAAEGDQARAIIKRITDKKTLLPRTTGDYRLKPGFKCQTGGIVQIGTPGSGFLMALVMFKLGMTDEAIQYLEENWTPIAETGAYQEHFVRDDNSTFCHGWGAGPVVLLPQFVLGIKPLAPGWKEIEITPQPGNLQWAEGTVPTALGDIEVSWKKVNGKLKLAYKVPDRIKVINRTGN